MRREEFEHPDHYRNGVICIKDLTGTRVLHCQPGSQPYGNAAKYHIDLPLIPQEDRIIKQYWHPATIRNDRGEWCNRPFFTYYTEKWATLVEEDLLAVFIEI